MIYENSCMMYISLIEALSGLPGYEGAEVCKTLYIYNLKLFIMSYIAADMWGERLFYNKPVRYVHETTKRSWWIDPKHNNSISVPIGTAKLFNDAGFLYTHYVPFDKRNMCFGDNPIEIKVY